MIRVFLPILEHRIVFIERSIVDFVAEIFDQNGRILSAEVTDRLMHCVVECRHILHHVRVLSSRHEDGEDVKVGAPLVILLLIQLVGINEERLSILQVLLNHALPVAEDRLLPHFHQLIVVLLLRLRQLRILPNAFLGDLDSHIVVK